MKRKYNAGFTLIEVVVAMAILAIVVIPVCSGMVLSVRINAKAEAVLNARIAVSSAVETLMAEGIPDTVEEEYTQSSGDVTITVTPVADEHYYNVEVSDKDGLVTVETRVRAITVAATEEEGGTP